MWNKSNPHINSFQPVIHSRSRAPREGAYPLEDKINDLYFHELYCYYIVAVKRLKPIKRSARNYTKANWEAIIDELANVIWTQNIDYTDVDTAWLNFKNILNKVCDRNIPHVTTKNNTNYP